MQMWKLNKADWKKYKESSNFAVTNDLLNNTSIEDNYNNIIQCITNLANDSIPSKNRNSKNNKKPKKFKPLPYWNNKCKDAIYKRNQYRNKMKKTRELGDFLRYKKQEAIVKQTLKTEAKNSWHDYCSTLTDQTKLGSVWNWARRMNGVSSYSSIPTLTNNSKIAETNLEKADILAESYANVSSSLNYSEKFLDYIKHNELENNPSEIESSCNNEIITMNEIFTLNELKQAINSAKNNKSPGDDKIPYELIKHLHKNALKTLLNFYNQIWSDGKLPTDWHHAVILPLLKPNKDATLPGSYRPISLTPSLCKIMEKLVTNRLRWYLEKNNLFTLNQSGFRKHKNTMDQILKLQDIILKKIKNKEHVLALFIDFERAYDMLHVPTLLRKLQTLGIVGNTYKWIENFLSNRTFQVKVGTELSNILKQQNGTPQGSVISPILFLIMINDISSGPDDINISLFADDSAVYTGHRNIKTLENKIQNSIDIIHNWCNKNGFKISLDKTVGVLFTNKRNIPTINIKVDQKCIKMDNKVKFLGVIFDRHLNWKAHIDYIMDKCKKRLNLMRAVSGYHWGASKKSLFAIYKALIRSILDYGDVAYSSASNSYLNKLSSIQTEALRICCGAPKKTAALALQNECGELPLHLRRLHNSLKMGIKIVANKNHTCKNIYKQHWSDTFKTPLNKNHSIYYRTSDFITSLHTQVIGPSFPPFPPWINMQIKIDISLQKQVSKKVDNPEFLRASALQLMSKYNNLIHIYTDGSKAGDVVSAAFIIPSLNVDRKIRVCNNSSIYAAEMTAIMEAVIWVVNSENHKDSKFVIFSDSLSVLTSVKEGNSKSRPNLLTELVMHLNKLDYDKITMVWIPSHIDIKGNEKVDKLAKEALSLDLINSTNYLELQEINTIIKQYLLNKWQLEYASDRRGQFYKSINPVVSTDIKLSDSNRQLEVQITRLRLGMANTNSRLFKIGKHPTGLCDLCHVNENIEHLLLECKKENIGDVLRNKCGLYKSEFTLKTLLNEGHLQRTVYSLIKVINKGKIL